MEALGKVWSRDELRLPERGTGCDHWLNASLVPGTEPSRLPCKRGAPGPIYKWGKRGSELGNLREQSHRGKLQGQDSNSALPMCSAESSQHRIPRNRGTRGLKRGRKAPK